MREGRNFLEYANAGERRRDNFLLRQLVLCALMTLMVGAVVLFFVLFRGLRSVAGLAAVSYPVTPGLSYAEDLDCSREGACRHPLFRPAPRQDDWCRR
jgi:hypothetical protein